MKYFFLFLSFTLSLVSFGQDVIPNQKKVDSLSITDVEEIPLEKSIQVIEDVPIYKGCEKKASPQDKNECMSQKIGRLFQKHFNTEMHEESDLIPGMKRIFLNFEIDKKGNVINIKARAEDKYLEAEAIRVAKLIPQLKPGKQRGKPVIVPYSLPLMVNVETNKHEGLTTYPVYRGCEKFSEYSELEACSKRKIMNYIKMSYDIELASRALPTEKSTQFLLEFTIDKKGKIKDINAKANHKAIAIEAIKVAKRLPKFKEPGYWEGVAVETPFKLLMTLYFN